MHASIRSQLAPHIERIGQSEVARRTAAEGIAPVSRPVLNRWLNASTVNGSENPAQITAAQADAVARACGLVLLATR